jgi:hypothetical protein
MSEFPDFPASVDDSFEEIETDDTTTPRTPTRVTLRGFGLSHGGVLFRIYVLYAVLLCCA